MPWCHFRCSCERLALNNDYNAEIAKKIISSELSQKQIVSHCENYTEVPSFDRSFRFLSVFLNQNLAKLIEKFFYRMSMDTIAIPNPPSSPPPASVPFRQVTLLLIFYFKSLICVQDLFNSW